jgi:hypothetical protein
MPKKIAMAGRPRPTPKPKKKSNGKKPNKKTLPIGGPPKSKKA